MEEAGFDTWWDVSDLRGGDRWATEIQAALKVSKYCVVVLSPDSIRSEWVEREYLYALGLELQIVPLLYKTCDVPLALANLQYIDLRGSRYSTGIQELLQLLNDQQKHRPQTARVNSRVRLDRLKRVVLSAVRDPIWQMIGVIVSVVAVLWAIYAFYTPPKTIVLTDTPTAAPTSTQTSVPPPTDTPTSAPTSTQTLAPSPTSTKASSPVTVSVPTSTPTVLPNDALTPNRTQMPTSTLSGIPTATRASAETTTTVSRVWDKWTVTRSFPSPGSGPTGVVRIGDALWVIVPGNGRLYQLDLDGNIIGELGIGGSGLMGNTGLTWDGKSLWWVVWSAVVQFDPANGTKSTRFEVHMDFVEGIVWDGTGLWIVDRAGNLVQYDRAGQRLRSLGIPLSAGYSVTGLAWVDGEIWVEDQWGKVVNRLDSKFSLVGSFNLSQCIGGAQATSLALFWDGGSLWLADADGNRIYQCTPGG